MKITQSNFTRCARAAVSMAIRRMEWAGATGEAARARVMSDSWRRTAEEMLGQSDWKRINAIPALAVTRQLSRSLRILILQAEIDRCKARGRK